MRIEYDLEAQKAMEPVYYHRKILVTKGNNPGRHRYSPDTTAEGRSQ